MERIFLFCFIIFCGFCSSQTLKDIDQQYKDAIAIAGKGKREEAMKALDLVIQASIESNYSKGKASAYYTKSLLFYYRRDFTNSIKTIQLCLGEPHAKQDLNLQAAAYHILGQNYMTIGLDDDGIKAYKCMIISAKGISDKATSIYQENIAYNDLAALYGNNKNDLDSAYFYSKKIYDNLVSHQLSRKDKKINTLLAKSALNIGQIFQKKNKSDSAEYYIKKSSEYAGILELPINSKKYDINTYRNNAVVKVSSQEYKTAEKYNDSLLEIAKRTSNLEDTKIALKIKSLISEKAKDTIQAHKDLKKYVEVSDQVNALDKKNIAQTFTGIIKEQDLQIEAKNKRTRYLWLTVVVMLIFLIISIYVFKQFTEKKKREKKKLLEEKRALLLEKQSEISKLESKVNESFDELVSLAKSNSPNFVVRFQEVYPDFCGKLIKLYPDIQNSELTFCAYLRLNFSNKDIAEYTFVALSTVHMRRYRLRKKFNIPGDQDIYLWMKNLDSSSEG